ncbi:MAG: hypothetical protein HY741_05130 [Chloroflexi bacterium]|nr:hypothetical protein [Chloroflexota bacterium]
METKTKQDGNMKKNVVVHLTILAVVVGLIVIAVLLASSNIDFVDLVIKLHGG